MSACLLCGGSRASMVFRGSDRLFATTSEEFTVVRCLDCGLMRLDPQPAAEKLHRYYPDRYWFTPDKTAAGRLEEAYRRVVLRDHVHFVDRAMRSTAAQGPLLDVGCGGGLFLRLMRRRGFRAMGLDFSAAAAAVAWKQGVPAVCALLEKAPFRPGTLAGLTMFHVIEHLSDPRAYLMAARQLLAPDGRLIVQAPNAACWQFRLLGRAWNGMDVPRHLFDFSAADLEKLIQSCGFEYGAPEVLFAARQSRRTGHQPVARSRPHGAAGAPARGERKRTADQGSRLPGADPGGGAIRSGRSGVRSRLYDHD